MSMWLYACSHACVRGCTIHKCARVLVYVLVCDCIGFAGVFSTFCCVLSFGNVLLECGYIYACPVCVQTGIASYTYTRLVCNSIV